MSAQSIVPTGVIAVPPKMGGARPRGRPKGSVKSLNTKRLRIHELGRLLEQEGLLPLWVMHDRLAWFVRSYKDAEREYESLGEDRKTPVGEAILSLVKEYSLNAVGVAREMAPYFHPKQPLAVAASSTETLVVRFEKGDESI